MTEVASHTVGDVGATVLIVEDDELIASSLARALGSAGYAVVVADGVQAAVESFGPADLVLCDLGLPDGDGLDLIGRLIETKPSLPVIALTARAEEADVVAGLSSGAVDYVTKPFRLAELLARIGAQLRQASVGGPTSGRGGSIVVGDLTIDLGARRVSVGDEPAVLTPREFDLLARLAAEPGVVVPRDEIMADVWDENWWGSTKTLDVHLNSLRRKLGEAPGAPSRITAVRGVGYRLERS